MIKVYPSVLNGTLKAEASKAHAQRLLFAASMPSTPTLVSNVPACDDIDTSLEALKVLGCKFAKGGESGQGSPGRDHGGALPQDQPRAGARF